MVVTTPIFLEYEEILSQKANQIVADTVLGAFLEARNVIAVTDYYYWELVQSDFDDNKFTNAFLNGQADYLVTNDAHFNIVKRTEFPKINVVTADEFLDILENAVTNR